MTWHPRTIGETVLDELARLGPGGDIAEVVAAWADAVGPEVAAQAWPASMQRDRTLTVTTSSSVWAFELTRLEPEIRTRLSARLGPKAPARLRFAPGRLPERGGEAVSVPPKGVPEVSAEARAAGAGVAAAIENDELRRLVARAAAVSLHRAGGLADDRVLW